VKKKKKTSCSFDFWRELNWKFKARATTGLFETNWKRLRRNAQRSDFLSRFFSVFGVEFLVMLQDLRQNLTRISSNNDISERIHASWGFVQEDN
jgi:hypothetical protein